nr:hypothetical protein [Psychrobacter sp. PraFG1]
MRRLAALGAIVGALLAADCSALGWQAASPKLESSANAIKDFCGL